MTCFRFQQWTATLAWVTLGVALLHPPHGLGIHFCWFDFLTGLPCPGCGLTRSLSCAVRGLFSESWHYHPLGIPLLFLFVFIAISSLRQPRSSASSGSRGKRDAQIHGVISTTIVIALAAIGAVRALLAITS